MYYFFLEKQNTLTQGWKLREVAFDPKYCYLYYSAPIARSDLNNNNNNNNDDNTYTDAEVNDQYASINESKSKRLMRSNEKECLEMQSKLSDKTRANENSSNATLSCLYKDSSKSKKCEDQQENTKFSPKYNSVSKVHREPSKLYCEDKVQKVESLSLTSSSHLVPPKSVPFAISQQNIPMIRKSKKMKKWVQWRHKIKLTELQYAADDYAVSARSNDFDEKILLTFTVAGLERSLNPPASSQSTFSHTRTNSSRGTSTIFGVSPSLSACNESVEHDCKEQFDADDNDDVVNGAKNDWSTNHNDSNYFSISGSGSNNRTKIKEDEVLLQPEYPSMLLQDDPNVTLPILPNDVENEPEDVFRDNELIASEEDSADEDTSSEESEEEEEESSSEEEQGDEEELEEEESSSSSSQQEKQTHKYKNNKLLKKNVYNDDGEDDKESTSSIPSSPTPTHTPHRFGFSWFRRKANKPLTITFRALNYDTFRIVSLRLRQALVRHGRCAPLHRGLPVYDPRNGIALATVPLHLRHVFHRLNDTVFYSLQCGHAVYIRQFREVRALYGYLCITHDSLYFLQEDGKCPRWLDLEDVTGVDYVLHESSSFVAVKAAAPYVDFIFLPVFPLYPPCVDFDHEETVDGIVSMLRRLFVQRLRLHEEVSLPPPSPVLEMEPQSTSTTQNSKLCKEHKQDMNEHELVMEKEEEMEKVKNEEPARKVVESVEDAEDNEDYDMLCHIKDRSREFTDVFKYVAARGASHLMPGRGVSWKTPQHFTYKRDLALALAEEEQDIDKNESYRDKLIKHDSVRSKDRQGSRKSSRANNAIHTSCSSFSSYSNKNNYSFSTTNTSTGRTSINTKVKAKLPFPAHSEDAMPSAQVKRYIVTQGDRGNMYFPPPPPTSAQNWHSSRSKYYDDNSSSVNHKNNINQSVQGHRQRSSLMSQASFTAMTVSHLLAPPSRDAELRAKDKLQMTRTDPIKRQERQARLNHELEHVKQSTLSLTSSSSCAAANTVNVPLSSTLSEQKQGEQYQQTKQEINAQQKRKAEHKVMLNKHTDPTHDISLSATFTHSPDQNNKLDLVNTNSSTKTSTSASLQTHLQSSTQMRSSRPTSYGLKPAPVVLQNDANTISQSLTTTTDNKESNSTSSNVVPTQIAPPAPATQKTMALTCQNDLEEEEHKTKADLMQTPISSSTAAFPVHVKTNNTNRTSSLSSLFSPTSAMVATNKQSPVIATNRGIKIPLPFPAKSTNTDIISNNNNSKDDSSDSKDKTHNNDDNTHICHEDKRNANALEDLMVFNTTITADPVTKSTDQSSAQDFVKNNDAKHDEEGKPDEINTATLTLTKQSTPNVQQQPLGFSVEQEQNQKDEVRKDNIFDANVENVCNDVCDEEETEEDEEENDDDDDDAFDSEDVNDLLQKV